MLLSTQAATLPSVTLSNYAPITRVKLRYEAFLAQLSESTNIAFGSGTTTGKPRVAGLHLSIEPLPGWSIGVGRIMQYGGGEREDSLRRSGQRVFRSVEPGQLGPHRCRVRQPSRVPHVAVRAGRSRCPSLCTSNTPARTRRDPATFASVTRRSRRGLRFRSSGRNLSATFELTEWQNGWYVHHIYRDGLRNENRVLGHWGADWRVLGDGVGARSLFARVTWEPTFGTLETSYRQLDNEDYSGANYETARQIDARYSRPWDQVFVGAELTVGRDVFGDSYSRLGAFIRF